MTMSLCVYAFLLCLLLGNVSARIPDTQPDENVNDEADAIDLQEFNEVQKLLRNNQTSVSNLRFSELREALQRAAGHNGVIDPDNIVKEYLRDPFPVQDFNISEQGTLTYYKGQFRNMSIIGLQGLNIKLMKFNIGWIQMHVVMEIPMIRLQGEYNINGKMTFLPLTGKGDFWMNVTGLEIFATSALNRTDNGTLQIADIILDVETADINLHFDNLMGGGRWGSISNSLLNKMSEMIFDHVKESLLGEVENDIKRYLNHQLQLVPTDFIHERSASLFDDILESIKEELKSTRFDPLRLQNFSEKVNHNLLFFVVRGEIEVYNGLLYGLSTLIRTGDVIATYENDAVTLEANLGFENLTGSYDWSLDFMGAGPMGHASLTVSQVSAYFKLRQPLHRHSPPQMEAFRIERIKHLWVDVTGLGTWDFVLEIIVNLISNAFKDSLARAISGPVKNVIQDKLNHLPMPLA